MTDSILVPLPIVLSVLAAALSLCLQRYRTAQRVLGLLVSAATLVVAVTLLLRVDAAGAIAVQLGGWAAPGGITLVVDRLSAIMLVLGTGMVLVVLVYAFGQLDAEEESLYFHPVYLVLNAGVAASFLTGDLFNLFVAFEVMLMASYVLLTLGGSSGQVRSGMTYVVINLIASTLFVTAVGFVYAATGSVNLADLVDKVDALPAGLQTALGLLLLVVFGIKAAIFPLFFWLPDAYPTASAPVTALFAGLLTKVGVYAIFRTQALLFPTAGEPSLLLLSVAGATMLVGVLGAIAQNDIKRILSFHIVSQIGYMIFGLGLFTVAGLAGGILYVVHHIIVKTALFLVAGVVERDTGTARLSRLGGLLEGRWFLAGLFIVAALSLAGLPPFSGFVAKLALLQAGLEADRLVVVAVSLLVSLLTLFSMTKIWGGAFWGKVEPVPAGGAVDQRAGAPERGPVPAGPAVSAERGKPLMMAATTALVAISLLVAVGAGPLYDLAERAAIGLLDRDAYVEAVLGP